MQEPQEALARAAAGDEAAWREIVSKYQRLIYATIRSFRLSTHDAQDVFQEAFLRLHRHSSRLRDARALTRWLIVTTRHLCLDHLAGQRAAQRAAQGAEQEFAHPALDLIVRLERAQRLRDALGQLNPRCQELLQILFYEQDQPDYGAAAARLGMPLGSVGPTRARCLEELLRQLRRQGDLDGGGT
jgi:RNA polymerase sigma factor (sigma-70 family)